MRIEQLEYVAAVTRHGSLRRAGEELHLSLPALSEALGKLERELGVTLLDRSRTGTRISPDGERLLPQMLEVLEAVERLHAAAGDLDADGRPIRVGTTSAATASVLAPALRAFRRRHPGGTVDVSTRTAIALDAALVDGTLDLVLVDALDGDVAPIGAEPTDLVPGQPVVVLPAGHPLTARPALDVEDLLDQAWVSMPEGSVMHRFARRAWGERLPAPAQVADSTAMAVMLAAQGLGLAVVPDYSVVDDALHRTGAVLVRPLGGPPTRVTLQLRLRPAVRRSAPLESLVTALRSRAADHGSTTRAWRVLSGQAERPVA